MIIPTRSWLTRTSLVLALGASALAPLFAAPVPVPNGDFEAGLEAWTLLKPEGFAHGTAEVVTDDVHGGKQAVRLRNEPAGEKVLIGLMDPKPIPLPDASRTFEITVWMKVLQAPEMVELRIASTDRAGNSLTPYNEKGWRFIRPAIAPHLGQWAAFTGEFVAQDEWGGVQLTLWTNGAGSDVLVDDITIRTVSPDDWAVAQSGARLPGEPPGVAIWSEGPLRKVYPGDTPTAQVGKELRLDAAGDERQVIQLCLRPEHELADVRVNFTELQGPGKLPASILRANLVGLIDIKKVTSGHGKPGPTPDPLLTDASFGLAAGQTRSIWITVHVPRDTPPGDYTGKVNLGGVGFGTYIPLKLHVYGFNLPERPTLRTIARIWQEHPGYDDLFRKDLQEHRCSGTSQLSGIKAELKDGQMVVDVSGLHAAVERDLRPYGFEVFNVPNVFLGDWSGLFNKEGKWFGVPVFTPEFDQAFTSYCRQVGDALRTQGVLPYALWQVWDEPHDEWIAKVQHLARLVKQAVPEARIYMTAAVNDQLTDTVNIWCLPWPSTYLPVAEQARAKGAELWAYENELYSMDVADSSLLMRGYLWRLKRYGIKGVEWWAISSWKSDPWTVPNQYEPQNGGGFFIYPTPDRKGAPIDSLRWEMYREGVEDYDILTLLAQEQDRALNQLGINDERLSGEEQARELAARVALDPAKVVNDPVAAEQARREACERIELLQGSKPVAIGIVRTPQQKTVLIAAGTAKVSLNGKAVGGKLIQHVAAADQPVKAQIVRGADRRELTLR